LYLSIRDNTWFLEPDKNMLLIFNHEITTSENETNHGAPTLPSMVHIVFEIEPEEYEKAKRLLVESNIIVEIEIEWENSNMFRSIYFRDPAGNLVEFITKNYWGVMD
jgi:catechol 2,3-dioxygenase-like lactoylglutathione lyase family enzyme